MRAEDTSRVPKRNCQPSGLAAQFLCLEGPWLRMDGPQGRGSLSRTVRTSGPRPGPVSWRCLTSFPSRDDQEPELSLHPQQYAGASAQGRPGDLGHGFSPSCYPVVWIKWKKHLMEGPAVPGGHKRSSRASVLSLGLLLQTQVGPCSSKLRMLRETRVLAELPSISALVGPEPCLIRVMQVALTRQDPANPFGSLVAPSWGRGRGAGAEAGSRAGVQL